MFFNPDADKIKDLEELMSEPKELIECTDFLKLIRNLYYNDNNLYTCNEFVYMQSCFESMRKNIICIIL